VFSAVSVAVTVQATYTAPKLWLFSRWLFSSGDVADEDVGLTINRPPTFLQLGTVDA
jgi:hypothetical protein